MRYSIVLVTALFPLICNATDDSPPARPDPVLSESTVGYPTVAAALTALQNKPGAEVAVKGGWTIITERASQVLWSFTPKDNPAFPAVVKRAVVQEGGKIYIATKVLCEAPKSACDQLVADFDMLTDKVREYVRQ